MSYRFEEWIDWLLTTANLSGPSVLLLTIPLAIIQGLFGVFPFATLVFIHIAVMNVTAGLLSSWLAGTVASIVVYFICRFFFADWINRKFAKGLAKYGKWQHYIDKYGVWAIIFLRTVPIVPNNVISFMSAISNIKLVPYIWSNILGNLSSILLFGILSLSVVQTDVNITVFIVLYAIFLMILIAIFFIRQHVVSRKQSS
ncbi:TVP38/TMEM64 family protein [Gorillibacterium massiliense]|uniref:TVP38/TMEM64 family protein n=1 Tax=Gorillibacterium massiliense TaxID=1280390 RepID=UPI0004B405CA|nr:VTT domain-containing protein [Gorillibacterium massiliense]